MKSLSEFMEQEPKNARLQQQRRTRKGSSVRYCNPYLVHSEFSFDDGFLEDDDQSRGNQSDSDLNLNVSIGRLNDKQTKLLGEIQRQRRTSSYLNRRSTLRRDSVLTEIRTEGRNIRSSSVRKKDLQNALGDLLSCYDGESTQGKVLKDISDRYQEKGRLRMSVCDGSAETATTAELSTEDLLMDDSSSRRSMADHSCSFRPDESICMNDISEHDLQPLNLSQEIKTRDSLGKRDSLEGVPEDSLSQFFNDRMDTFSRNIDFCRREVFAPLWGQFHG